MGFIQYVKDTRNELRHVAWPTRTQTIVFTAFVMALSVVVALYLGVFDYVFTQGLERVLERVAPPAQTAEVSQGLIEIATSSETGAETESNPIIIE